ncbi:MAG TPA: hypothetical protein VG434_03895 [Sphingomicrobium sp.]|nr:hypothetical protein [Sphingomicrobium sp.]
MSGAARVDSDDKLPTVIDAICLGVITILSALPYVPRLGFYSDDWAILAGFVAEPHPSLLALIAENFASRPVQGIYLKFLFDAFGLDPLGYHIVNTAVLGACASLLYLLLARLRVGRTEAFAATLLFVMLPQLSTVRVWYSAFQIPLSMAMMLVSMQCQLSFSLSRKVGWLVAAVVSAVLSIGAYEIFTPLIVGFAAALLFGERRNFTKTNGALAAAVILGVVGLAVAYKLFFSSGRVGSVTDPERYVRGLHQFFRLDYDWRVDSSMNVIATPSAYFWEPMRGWWIGAQSLVGGRSSFLVMGVAVLIATLAFWRLSGRPDSNTPSTPRRLLLLGIAAFLLGNATFLIVPSVVFTSTGIGNRVQVAAAIGVAMIFAALFADAANAFPQRLRTIAHCAIVVIVTGAAFVRLSAIEAYWAEAPALQERVLDAAKVDLKSIPGNSTVILDGVCPYHGPAMVFEAWDVGGALSIALQRPIEGDARSDRTSPTRLGIATSIYNQPALYPYGPRLFVYNPSQHLLLALADPAAAARYFGTHPLRRCPGFVARGVEV